MDTTNNPTTKTKVFLSLFGHGNWSAEHDNHYFFMPYPIETVLQGLMLTERPPPPPPPPPEVPPGAVMRTEELVSPQQEQVSAIEPTSTASTTTNTTATITSNATTTTETIAVEPPQPEQEPTTTTTAASPSSAMYCHGMDLVSMGEPGSWPLYRCINDYQPLYSLPEGTNDTNKNSTSILAQNNEPLTSLPIVIDETDSTNSLTQDGGSSVSLQENKPLSFVPSIVTDGPDGSSSAQQSTSHLPHPITIPPRRPFRVHLNQNTQKNNNTSSSSSGNKPPPRTIEELNRHDASLLHWQYVFEVCKRLFHTPRMDQKQGLGREQGLGGEKEETAEAGHLCSDTDRCNNIELFIFQQSCGSGGMWLWLQENPIYEKVYG